MGIVGAICWACQLKMMKEGFEEKNMPLIKMISLVIIAVLCLLASYFFYEHYFSVRVDLDNCVQFYVDKGFFSGVVLVAKDGKVLLSKAYGMANVELDVPNKSNTKFRIGSITKSFTAMAILQLQEMGLLNLQDPLSKYISDYPNGDEITISHLLRHTSGIPHDVPDYKNLKIKSHTLEERIALFKNLPLAFKPGEKEFYSDSGYILLTYIIEKVSGKKYEEFLQEHIFDPLDMKDTGYDSYKRIIKNRALGYIVDGELSNADYINMSYESGCGALYSTVEDLYKWDRALSSEKLISKKNWEEISLLPDSIDMGWGTKYTGGYKWGTHGGLVSGFITFIGRYVNDDACIIVLSNLVNASLFKIVKNLELILFEQEPECLKKHITISINPKTYDQYIGRYITKDGTTTFIVTKDHDRLFIEEVGDFKYEVFPESETEFFIKQMDVSYSFEKDKDGNIQKLIEYGTIGNTIAEKEK